MQNRQKASLDQETGGGHNHLTGFSSAPVVFPYWSNYHIQLIVLLMTVINQVVLPNLVSRRPHGAPGPDVSSFQVPNVRTSLTLPATASFQPAALFTGK